MEKNLEKDIIVVKNLKKYFKTTRGTVKAVDGISFSVKYGETFGLVGESGSGKSTAGYVILGIYVPSSGKIYYKGRDISKGVPRRPKSIKKEIQIVFQDPGTSLNPKRTIRQILELPLKLHARPKEKDLSDGVIKLLKLVELPVDYTDRYPREVGGGEKQMVAVARALAPNPKFIVLDEPTSALDVSMQAKMMNMILRIQKKFNLSYLMITHDLSLMRNVADRVAIMYLGKICEIAPTWKFFTSPKHPYTRMLLSSAPVLTKEEEELKPKKIVSTGEIPSPVNVPLGCSFNTRCPEKTEICFKEDPIMKGVEEDHFVRCHIYK